MGRVTATLGGVVTMVALVPGCGFGEGLTTAPTVSKDALQTEIANRITEAGEKPRSVTCKEDLVGEIGRTARCEVVLSPINTFEPVVTVTGVNGTTIDYEVSPAVSKEQLEKTVGRMVTAAGDKVGAVSCESGLDGKVGATAFCTVETDGVKVRRTVEVNRVEGLLMNFDLLPV